MRELGRKGGRASVRSRLGLGDDLPDALRAKARKRLDAALDDPDPKIRLAAARAIASYSPERPPVEAAAPEQRHTGRGVYSVLDLFAAFAGLKLFSQFDIGISEEAERELIAKLKERGLLDEDERPPSTSRRLPADEKEPLATPEPVPQQAPPDVLSGMTDGPGPDFDESRYGSDPPELSWPQP
jgi:hypothetical protein